MTRQRSLHQRYAMSAICLRRCYAMSGTDAACRATRDDGRYGRGATCYGGVVSWPTDLLRDVRSLGTDLDVWCGGNRGERSRGVLNASVWRWMLDDRREVNVLNVLFRSFERLGHGFARFRNMDCVSGTQTAGFSHNICEQNPIG
eukprot:1065094-Rhodomonas_salina.1